MIKISKNIHIIQALTLIIFFVLAFPQNSLAIKQKKAFDRGLIVLAPSAMTNAMHEVIQQFSRKMNISVSASFDSTSELSEIINSGEPANIFISEDKNALKNLQQMGLLNVFSIKELVSDELVLVVPKNSFLIKKTKKLNTDEEKISFIVKTSLISIPDFELDAIGFYAKQSLTNLRLWAEVEKKLIKTNNSSASLYLATNGNTPAIVYKSEAINNEGVKIIATLPQETYEKIIYKIAIVADISSETTMADSEEFIEFITSSKIKNHLIQNGFQKISK